MVDGKETFSLELGDFLLGGHLEIFITFMTPAPFYMNIDYALKVELNV